MDQFIRLSYEAIERWYREHQKKATKIIQSSYLIEKPPQGRIIEKVDMTRGQMKDDIDYSMILLSRVMGLLEAGHLSAFMVNFFETIKTTKIPLEWATTLSKNL